MCACPCHHIPALTVEVVALQSPPFPQSEFPDTRDTTMSDSYFQQLFAERIGGANYGKGTAIYKFEKIKRAKRKVLADHPERQLIDFGIGENDEMAPVSVRARMAEEINRPENR